MPKPNQVNHQLFKAVRNGQLSKVKKFIDLYGLSYSPHWLDGYALLYNAIQHKQTETAKLLLRNGSEVNSKSENPLMTPLHYAVKNDDVEVVEMLLNKGAHTAIEANDGSTPLLIAIMKNYPRIICLLINHGAAFDVASTSWNKSGKTLLHFACATGHENLVELLLGHHADVNAKDRHDSTPLHVAAVSGNLEVVKCLLIHGADINAKNLKNQTPLSLAAEQNSLTILRNILSYKPDSSDENNRLALCSTVKSTHFTNYRYGPSVKKHNSQLIVEDLLEYGFAIKPHDVADSSLLYAAVGNGYEKIVEDLLKCGTDVNYSEATTGGKSSLLHTAVKKGQNSIVQLLIKYGADVNSKDKTGHTPIYFAIQNKYLGIAMQLLDNKAVFGSSFDLLCLAIESNNTKTVEKMLSFDGVDINATNDSGTTALHFVMPHVKTGNSGCKSWSQCLVFYTAVKKDQNSIVQLLIKHGADVNSKDKTGHTPIYFAIQTKNLGIAMQLLDNKAFVESSFDLLRLAIETKNMKTVEKFLSFNGVDIDATNDSGITALHIAIEYGQIEIVKLFLDKGANVNNVPANGETALFKACEIGYNEIVEILLKFGAESEFERARYKIPLHAAAKNNNEKIVETLLRYDADIDFKNNEGETALCIALKNINDDVVNILLEHGSDINIIPKSIYSEFIFMRRRYQLIKSHFERRVIKLTAANLYVNEENLCLMDSPAYMGFRTNCEKEIKNMKSEKIVDKFFFYDILTKRMDKLTVYSRNKKIMQVLTINNYKTKFPIYARMIDLRFQQGIKRNDLLEQSYRFFHILSDSPPVFPHDCIDNICNYLSNYDLKNLVKACE